MIQYIIILQYAIIVKYFFDFFEKFFFARQKADNIPTFRDVYPLFLCIKMSTVHYKLSTIPPFCK